MVKPSNKLATSEIELVSTQKTKTVSQKSVLTYHIGKDEEANQYIRIWVNSGNGYFSNEWIPVSRILEILAKHKAEPFTSQILDELFTGKSVNSASFLGAVLLNERLLDFAEGKKRKLVCTGSGLKTDKAKSRKTVKKAAAKPARKASK
jgi:hypothetical protein